LWRTNCRQIALNDGLIDAICGQFPRRHWNDGDVATHVAFLRGINLGPNNKISMPELRTMAEGLGYTDVATYINSGNLIINSPKKAGTTDKDLDREPLSGREPEPSHGRIPDEGAA
jgi:hypothetical protein